MVDTDTKKSSRTPWLWIPTLYFAEGIPYVIVMTVAGIMYKRMEISNTDIALYTSWLYLPWVIKPLWSPFVDVLKTKRFWIVTIQLILGALLGGVALVLPMPHFFQYTILLFWLIAFNSATQDIAIDGFYMLGLSQEHQAFFIGIRNTFYRLAMVSGQGLLIMLAGFFEQRYSLQIAWSMVFTITAVLFMIFSFYHKYLLPFPEEEKKNNSVHFQDFWKAIQTFFQKKNILVILAFLLFYRFAESQLIKIASPFLLDKRNLGGLELSTTQVGFVYGTVGIIALVCGGLLGGILASRKGLRYWLWVMVCAINLPNIVYVYLSFFQPDNFWSINICVFVEQFGYGFGFTAYTLYMLHISAGEHETAHYALCTGLMALGMMLPGMFSGWIQEMLGYKMFFVWIMFATIPSFFVTRLVWKKI